MNKRRPKYYALPITDEIRKHREKIDKGFCKKSKLWKEVEALFWSLVFKEETERELSFGCYQTPRHPGCQ